MPPEQGPRLRLQALAAQQFGHFGMADAAECGVTRSTVHRMRRAGVVEPAGRGSYRFAAAPPTEMGAVVAALLAAGPGAVVARHSALSLLGLAGVTPPTIELLRADTTPLAIPGATVHRTRRLTERDVTTLEAAPRIRLTTAARSLVDVAGGYDWLGMARLVDDAICGRLTTRRWLYRTAVRLRAGRAGVAAILRLTGPGAEGEFWSWLERTSSRLWARHGVPAPEWNVEVRDERGRIGVVDALWRARSVITELEGLRFHTSPAQRRRDAERFNRLGKRHRVLRFTWLDVVERPDYVVETLRDALGVSPSSRKPRRG